MSPGEPPAAPRRQELGPYRLGMLLGAGGMGEVYKAFDDRLGRWVAAKRLRGEATAGARSRFRREARALARLGHPAIVQVFDVVEDDAGDWIVMELVEGSTLAELGVGGPLDAGLVLDFGRQIASALEAAHTRGIVHRDLKTENVMVLPSGHVKVLDFGLARGVAALPIAAGAFDGPALAGELAFSLPGRIAGTPRAMSPEQAAGGDVGPRSDLFALGVLLYEISTARSPFQAPTVEETLRRVANHRPPPARRLHPRVPRELSELVDRLLETDPGRRPRSAAAVADELSAIAAADPVYRVTSYDLSWLENPSEIRKLGAGATTADAPMAGTSRTDAVVATLLSSDLVCSGRPIEELADRDAGALLERHDRLTRDLLEVHGGRSLGPGDGGLTAAERSHRLLLFDRPWNAVSFALAYHDGLSGEEPKAALAARVGIHLGEMILHRNSLSDVDRGARQVELEGPAAPSVARLAALAGGGQTLLTRTAYETARRSAASESDRHLEWRAHGRYRFRRAGAEVEVFEVGVPGIAPLAAPSGSHEVRRVAGPLPEATPALTASGWTASATGPRSVRLRVWPPPEVPEYPYPVLLPYSHPDFMAGRDQEIARLRRLLEMPVPILGLAAPSGAGKSSLLLAGLVPALRAGGFPRRGTNETAPVALVRHPAEAGVASRLINDLLDGAEPVEDEDTPGFTSRLAEVERLAGTAPILVLDQFEDVLRKGAAAARVALGALMAASVERRPGLQAPPCRWLIAYRREFHGRLSLWLGDVLADARAAGLAGIEALPHDLSGVERFHGMTLAPLATPAPASPDPLAEATQIFQAAIEKPLALAELSPPGSGSLGEGLGVRVPWQFPPGHAERLARAFAETRLARPEAPLAPELQVVLAHLLADADSDGRVTVPEDPGPLIDRALEDHLGRALEAAFPEDSGASRTGRARALLALREMATTGERDEGLRPADLVRAIGDGGEEILEALATPLTRLVIVREAAEGPRWVLAHDRMAEAVVRLVAEEGRRGKLLLDTELLALRRFVDLRTALYRSGETATSTRVQRRRFRRIRDHAEALLWDGEARAWFEACRRRRRADRRRRWALAAVAVLLLALVGRGAWSRARRLGEHRALLEQVAQGEPEAAFQALSELSSRPDADAEQLLALLRRRGAPMDVLESGLGGLEGPQRGAAVLRAVEITLPWVAETPQDQRLIANLVWTLDYAPGRAPAAAERAQALRDRVLAPLRRLRPPPPPPEPGDPDWIEVPAGSFMMGTEAGEKGNARERPRHEVTISAFRMLRHEVTNAEFRRLFPDHPGDDDLPALNVNWYAATTYAAWLDGRLPTEAEWEYAAHAGCRFAYCARDGAETTVDAVAWTRRSSRDATGEPGPRPVMHLEPNPWGFYDMLGNSFEWVADWTEDYPAALQHDPWGPTADPDRGRRLHRGGSFFNLPSKTRVTIRPGNVPGYEFVYLGFRVALSASAVITTRKPEVPGV